MRQSRSKEGTINFFSLSFLLLIFHLPHISLNSTIRARPKSNKKFKVQDQFVQLEPYRPSEHYFLFFIFLNKENNKKSLKSSHPRQQPTTGIGGTDAQFTGRDPKNHALTSQWARKFGAFKNYQESRSTRRFGRLCSGQPLTKSVHENMSIKNTIWLHTGSSEYKVKFSCLTFQPQHKTNPNNCT